MTALIISVKTKQHVWMLKQDTNVYAPQAIKENTVKRRSTCVIATHVKMMQVVYRLLMISYVHAKTGGKGKYARLVSEHIEVLCRIQVTLTLIDSIYHSIIRMCSIAYTCLDWHYKFSSVRPHLHLHWYRFRRMWKFSGAVLSWFLTKLVNPLTPGVH